MMKEYIKVYWEHTSEKEVNEPVVIVYEVDLTEERYATRMIDIYADSHTENIEDQAQRFVTEAPVITMEEINSGEYGTEFHACLMTRAMFEEIWQTKTYHGSLYWDKDSNQ